MNPTPHPRSDSLCDVVYARAANSGIWLARGGAGALSTTREFSRACACANATEALALWAKLCAQTRAGNAKAPAWSENPPSLFKGMSAASAPEGLSLYLALCEGRFVRQKPGYGSSFDWALTADPSEAHVFHNPESALEAARSACPAMAERPAMAALPLLARFGAPIHAPDHPGDPLAGALAAASARADLERALPAASAAGAPGKRRGL